MCFGHAQRGTTSIPTGGREIPEGPLLAQQAALADFADLDLQPAPRVSPWPAAQAEEGRSLLGWGERDPMPNGLPIRCPKKRAPIGAPLGRLDHPDGGTSPALQIAGKLMGLGHGHEADLPARLCRDGPGRHRGAYGQRP